MPHCGVTDDEATATSAAAIADAKAVLPSGGGKGRPEEQIVTRRHV
eukprot:CAMPEP_0181210090 /NCGR_PEP_ID=MMETSP1096-20121128/23036_1 /TAXON_ID=156174 ORGANISM="Chrysochromulina ericina, Strain CCMP281" /NCGR_SAMPLE_ID=MMETSP1096 /ASSEMBLY_ACC=CAM_ASM_000453 /LENGTH=45 /DNA_ID= /DNA_START= /DNA_END= /DNA_ORIENTATION=